MGMLFRHHREPAKKKPVKAEKPVVKDTIPEPEIVEKDKPDKKFRHK